MSSLKIRVQAKEQLLRLLQGDPPDWATAEDLITSRILWLDGVEDHNANTRERYISVHGTNQEELIARVASRGCIRMRNQDVIQLFDLIDVGTEVEILP